MGAIAGIAAVVVLISTTRSLLFHIDRVDVESLVAGTLIVLAVTLVACLAPALRAARTDPVGVLHGD